MRWFENTWGKFWRRMNLRRRGFRFIEPKNDCVISLRLVCKTFHADVYYRPLRNVILRAARREPQKYRYLMVNVDADGDLYFTGEDLRAFREIFVNYFDAAGFDYLCRGLCEAKGRV